MLDKEMSLRHLQPEMPQKASSDDACQCARKPLEYNRDSCAGRQGRDNSAGVSAEPIRLAGTHEKSLWILNPDQHALSGRIQCSCSRGENRLSTAATVWKACTL